MIDTDVFVELERGAEADHLEGLVGHAERGISVITVSELLHGVHRARGAVAARRAAFVESVLAAMEPLPITESIARLHAHLSAQLASAGTHVGAHDLLIGATALAHGHRVLTGNAEEFLRIPGLDVVDFRA